MGAVVPRVLIRELPKVQDLLHVFSDAHLTAYCGDLCSVLGHRTFHALAYDSAADAASMQACRFGVPTYLADLVRSDFGSAMAARETKMIPYPAAEVVRE